MLKEHKSRSSENTCNNRSKELTKINEKEKASAIVTKTCVYKSSHRKWEEENEHTKASS